jgi:RNA polymerase sigma factor (sigma-70 family)
MADALIERTVKPRVAPLTRRNLAGEVYERLPWVEAEIEEALALSWQIVRIRARSHDIQSLQYLQEETLVYLIRESFREERRETVDELSGILIRRCARRINRLIRGSVERRYVDDCFSYVIKQVFERILDLQTDRGDFAQVRFWVFLNRQVIEAIKLYLIEEQRDAQTDSLTADEESESEAIPEFEPEDEHTFKADDNAIVQEALAILKEPIRTAFILRHYEGWQIHSDDPNEPTICGKFGKPAKTIYNWLKKAEKELREWRGGEK